MVNRILVFGILIGLLGACTGMNTTTKGNFQKRIQRVTPKDIKDHTQKILVGEYQYELEETSESRSSMYYETSWKELNLTSDEKEKNISNVRVRFKLRSRETRGGPTNTYNVHSLKLTAEVESYQTTNGSSNWVRAEITPQRRDYLENIYDDFKLEFDSGSMDFN